MPDSTCIQTRQSLQWQRTRCEGYWRHGGWYAFESRRKVRKLRAAVGADRRELEVGEWRRRQRQSPLRTKAAQ